MVSVSVKKTKFCEQVEQRRLAFVPYYEMVTSQTALMVWKSNKAKDSLGRNLFPNRSIIMPTRSINCLKATQPVPGNNTLAANLMARA